MANEYRNGADPEVIVDAFAMVREVRRQETKYGYGAAHDQEEDYAAGELAMLACYMAWPTENLPEYDGHEHYGIGLLMPVNRDESEHSYRKGRGRREQLIVAGAFILDELRRLRNAGGAGDSHD